MENLKMEKQFLQYIFFVHVHQNSTNIDWMFSVAKVSIIEYVYIFPEKYSVIYLLYNE